MTKQLDDACDELGVAVRAIVEALELDHETAGQCLMTAAVFELAAKCDYTAPQLLTVLRESAERVADYKAQEISDGLKPVLHS